ncbi:hydroxyacid dehydrogenase [Rhodovulum sulfidophilum]|uniref:2-hydroxyacid dehydrogenase n=1 Tax=Rhodovulum visakhapatnamense TaxID=364297 RepID=A0ABS1RHG1_9RHOB|nr:2-hydroxyacid dehydrogenase [Rhodovulum visakhapatnamense]MBL3571236.1 2-hydroxyacid dehydrogenase [Rhodovulum visakhapatnamense]MBL3579081.1 2-hydroxyacid dehydrogenase [Rhodovulum visakhapatnamense]OLS45086.1 hydroxyacid dehydrogenase [Rhodovulum sulfidophilum]
MTDTPLLICGAAFTEDERARLSTAVSSVSVDGPGAIAGLAPAGSARLRAVAYKGHEPFGAAEMDRLPGLGLIANFGVGYDAIDVAAATQRGIRVTNTPDVLNDDVADLAVGLILAQARSLVRGDGWVRSGRWTKYGAMPLARKVSGARAGIVGLGRIGREIADRLAAFKMEIHYHSRQEKETPGWQYHADPVSLARAVDFLVVALVGGPETRNYVSAEAIAALGPKGVLINISRGTTVDEGALIAALEEHRIAGAGLDVYLDEPAIDPRFQGLENVVLQPHVGSATTETRRAMAELQLANIRAFLDGQPLPTPVN